MSRMWVTLQCLSRSEPLTITSELCSLSRMWVPLQCLSRSGPLMRMVKHASSLWVACWCLIRSELLTRIAEHVSSLWVISSPVFELIYWQDWLNTYLASELLSRVYMNLNHWQEWLISYSECNLISLSDFQCNTIDWLFLRPMLWWPSYIPTLNPMILAHL